MICETLVRGALCSQAYRKWERPDFFKKLGLPPPTATPKCTGLEEAAAYIIDHFILPYYKGLPARLTPEIVEALEAVSAPIIALEEELAAYVPEDPLMVFSGPCVFGLRLQKNVVITGPELIINKLDSYVTPRRHFVAIESGDPEEISARYGVEAVVSCLAEPPVPLKRYVITCWEYQWLGDLLSKALGFEPPSGGIPAPLRNAKLLIKYPKKRLK
ncbi:hypothetical protein [Pyrobaculum aerophilum]|uniref:hypothetical protein n=1 Tax=Pyrobaculum aerophilum TaxID=13773 RepID=UPI0023F4F1DA|nr:MULTISPECIES: hypothetical protein [Pyrobaculum]MCX8135600.1 hypothetical protein [Pyrobaculum aerophilum]